MRLAVDSFTLFIFLGGQAEAIKLLQSNILTDMPKRPYKITIVTIGEDEFDVVCTLPATAGVIDDVFRDAHVRREQAADHRLGGEWVMDAFDTAKEANFDNGHIISEGVGSAKLPSPDWGKIILWFKTEVEK